MICAQKITHNVWTEADYVYKPTSNAPLALPLSSLFPLPLPFSHCVHATLQQESWQIEALHVQFANFAPKEIQAKKQHPKKLALKHIQSRREAFENLLSNGSPLSIHEKYPN
jgi:hypothetical protein